MKLSPAGLILVAFVTPAGVASGQPLSENDKRISAHAQHMLTEGRRIFRFDTMGSESFWGDALQLHRAIAGEKNGGVGGGVSPKTALSVGLKVDADALPAELVAQIKAGKVDLEDPATTLALLKLNAVVGVTGLFDSAGRMRSMGVQCALCHSTVDDSFAPGIGRRLDGWANRDLNVGAIVSLAPNLKPFTDLLKVDEATVKKVLASWGPGRYDALLDKDGKAFRPDGGQAGDPHSPGVRSRRGEPEYLDRLRLGAVLERVCRYDPDARRRYLHRQAPQRQKAIPGRREEPLRRDAQQRPTW